jgi:hypothetical protein
MYLEALHHSNVSYLFFSENLNVIQHLFPRQSKSDEDYDRFAFDLSPEPQTTRTPGQAEEKTSVEKAEVEASDLVRVPTSDETDPSNYQLYKSRVPADPDDKSDLYFIGEFVTGWLRCYGNVPQSELFRKEAFTYSCSKCDTNGV